MTTAERCILRIDGERDDTVMVCREYNEGCSVCESGGTLDSDVWDDEPGEENG